LLLTTGPVAGSLDDGVDRLARLWSQFIAGLPAAGVGLGVLALFVVVAHIIRYSVRRHAAKRRKHHNLVLATGRLVYAVMLVLGLLVAAVITFPNFTPTGLLTSLGVGSLVIGLAFKDVLQNYLAGILLLVAEPFRSGDQIVFQGYEGTVDDIQPRATFVRTYDGRRVIIPNAELFTNSVTVNTAFDKRRMEYDVGIGVSDDIELAKRLIVEAIRQTGGAEEDPPPEALTVELAPSSVNIRARWWIRPPVIHEAFDARDKVLAAIKDKLLASGIDLPYPTQQVLLHDQTEPGDGDRFRQREGWPPPRADSPPHGDSRATHDGQNAADPPSRSARR
jgi:small-conductance mechanosensitive channel